MEIFWRDIVFQGILISEKSLKKILDVISAISAIRKFLSYAKNEVHMTCIFKPKREEIYTSDILEKEVTLQVVAVGILKNEKDEITNIGIKIKDKNHYSQNKVAHVTILVLNGGKAVNTAKCEWRWTTDFTIIGKFAVFDKDSNPFYKVTY